MIEKNLPAYEIVIHITRVLPSAVSLEAAYTLRPGVFLLVDLRTSYYYFPESRKKNLRLFFLFYPLILNIICFVEKYIFDVLFVYF